MQRLAFLLIFCFSLTLLSAEDENIATSARYIEGSWTTPEPTIPSSYYDVPGDRVPTSNGQTTELDLSVNDVLADSVKPITADSFKAMAPQAAQNAKKVSHNSSLKGTRKQKKKSKKIKK